MSHASKNRRHKSPLIPRFALAGLAMEVSRNWAPTLTSNKPAALMFSASKTIVMSFGRGTLCLPRTLPWQAFSSRLCPSAPISVWDPVSGRRQYRRRNRYRAATTCCPGSQGSFRCFPLLSMLWEAGRDKCFSLLLCFLAPSFRCAEDTARGVAGALSHSVHHCLLNLHPFSETSWAEAVVAFI